MGLLHLLAPDLTVVYLMLCKLGRICDIDLGCHRGPRPLDGFCDSRLVYKVLCVCLSLIQLTNINRMT